jgi:hypothetical protein
MTEYNVAMEKQEACLVHKEHRRFSNLRFHFVTDGKEYAMTHDTFSNQISELREKGKVELAGNSGIAFFMFGKSRTRLSTPIHIGVLLSHAHNRILNIKKHPLYIKHHPFLKDHHTSDLNQIDDSLEQSANLKMRTKEHHYDLKQLIHCNLVRLEAMFRLQRSKTHQRELMEYDDE